MFSHWVKAELTNDVLGGLAEEISKESVEGGAWFLLAAYIKFEGKK